MSSSRLKKAMETRADHPAVCRKTPAKHGFFAVGRVRPRIYFSIVCKVVKILFWGQQAVAGRCVSLFLRWLIVDLSELIAGIWCGEHTSWSVFDHQAAWKQSPSKGVSCATSGSGERRCFEIHQRPTQRCLAQSVGEAGPRV